MKEDDTFYIHLRVANEVLRVRIERDEEVEVVYRNAEKLINRLLDAYRKKYVSTDHEELDLKKLLTMTVLHLAVSNVEHSLHSDETICFNEIERLDKEIEACLRR